MVLTACLSSGARAMTLTLALTGLALANPTSAQTFKSVQTPAEPLVLKARGSFFVGGRSVQQSAAEILLGPDDSVTVDQMYVEYMVPAGKTKLPVVMVHGAGLSGKSYDTTPDGRMGWRSERQLASALRRLRLLRTSGCPLPSRD